MDPVHFKTFLFFFCSMFISVYRFSCAVGNVSSIAITALNHAQIKTPKTGCDYKTMETTARVQT